MGEARDDGQTAAQTLGEWGSALFAHGGLRAGWRRLFRCDPGELSAGWPRRLSRETARAWFRGPDVLVRLVRTPQDGASEAWLLLPVEACARLVDRVLGGAGQSGFAAALGAPTEAECGVLAYGISHLCSASGAPWIVRDVTSISALALLEEAAGMVLCPFALGMPWASVEARVLLTPALAKAIASDHVLTLALRDAIDPSALSALALGDVLVGDAWALTSTTRGLVGAVELSIEGSDARFRARLEGAQVTVEGPLLEARAAGGAELVLARQRVGFAALSEIAAGVPTAFAAVPNESAELYQNGVLLAEGKLVSVRGALGVRISRIAHSMR